MTELWKNNASSILVNSIAASDTSILVGDGSLFPFPDTGNGDFFWLTLAQSGALEIVKCVERADNTLTIERGQQGTAARAFITGAIVEQRITAASLEAIAASEAGVNAATIAAHIAETDGAHGISPFGAALVDDVDQATARNTLGLGTAAVQAVGAFELAGAVAAHLAVADPHAGYIKADGTRAFTGTLAGTLSVADSIAAVTGEFYLSSGHRVMDGTIVNLASYLPRDATGAFGQINFAKDFYFTGSTDDAGTRVRNLLQLHMDASGAVSDYVFVPSRFETSGYITSAGSVYIAQLEAFANSGAPATAGYYPRSGTEEGRLEYIGDMYFFGNTDAAGTRRTQMMRWHTDPSVGLDYVQVVPFLTATGGFASGLYSVLSGDVSLLDRTASRFIALDASKVITSVVPPTITGSRGGNAAIASLLTELATLNLIVDSTTA